MGYGEWSARDFRRAARGSDAFSYSRDVTSRPREEQRCHQLLDPFGLTMRESRDSAEHPESNAIVIGLDVTGSMAMVVVEIRDSLGKLMDMLLNGDYISDPQLLFYAVGDATCDAIPLQVSQFESDIRINEQLSLVVLEKGGGGQLMESYELGAYFAVCHTSMDCLEKRSRKGYLFSIGDELPYPGVSRSQVQEIFGEALQVNLSVADIVEKAQAKYSAFHIIPRGSSHFSDPKIRNTWTKLLGGEQFVFMLDDPEATAETIALAIGLNEGRVTLDEGIALISENSGKQIAAAASSALETFAAYVQNNTAARTRKNSERKNSGKRSGKSPRGPAADKKDSDKWKL